MAETEGPQPAAEETTIGLKRLELVSLALFLACWTVDVLSLVGLVPLAGSFPLSLYGLYGLAAALGWLVGNLYVQRARPFPPPLRRRFLLIYSSAPLGILFLLRAMAPAAEQQAAPLVPLYALAVYAIFFLVPVMVRIPFRAGKR